ncbi:zf-HC2 domain-containing protein [Pseudonocardia sp. KRD-184]|uniref:Zf-HC2 domain-containing protein n=1 Tax=Pseudonocardia oceani TaxID=2792013 RepID=A0ABS6UI45_9PSEU|nr:zf-HC2 domain-containing protein [Pseudonocardia oceani]MBW0091794.1 zf-HC2 domain-containing protein [Pseudonocardia oceani]MBW0100673.1 zf-HC2 domain-containing protein [Pseudonocardia oceani]MBW0113189.1 zf-HC2 domain-containing protein [Pseudonocardia oceani]MBW0123941.1 zf-HC2 domain-containing protein [Pseudonocardia oceani]MBW0131898.1 zf-HC2 domain-containing protein [Pseudonocardia oceani]
MTLHDRGDLGAHALGLLDDHEARAVDAHLATCADCRREFASLSHTALALRDVPPEVFLDGPPDSDLLLARTVRAVRAERGGARRRRRLALVAAAVAVAVALVGGGALLGQALAPGATTVAAGARTVDGTAGPIVASATVTPAAGWVRVATTVRGIPAGKRCTIIVVGRDGTENVAGSWLVSPTWEVEGGTVQGSTIIDPEDVLAVAIRDEGGTDLITLPV